MRASGPAATLLALTLAGLAGIDGAVQEESPQEAAAPTTSRAEELWRSVGEAAVVEGVPRRAVEAFHLAAEVLTRDGAQTNEFSADYHFLAPRYIRFKLESDRETGRGPGEGQRAYWLRDPKRGEIAVLEGREYAEDRQLVDRMLAVARNFLALTDPSRIRVEAVELLSGPPPELPPGLEERARELDWLSVVSPDFALDARGGAEATGRLYRARIGVSQRHGLPSLVVVQEAEPGSRPASPLLFELSRYGAFDGLRIPRTILVRRPGDGPGSSFAELPAQEIYVTSADLDPPLTQRDFEPR